MEYIPILAGLGVFGILVLLFIASYKKAKSDEALIVSGLGKLPKVVVGKAGFALPFLQRVDKLNLRLIQIDVRATKIPTQEFINVNVDAVANVQIPNDVNYIRIAAQNFLNQRPEYIAQTVQQVLEGNMREIVGQMELRDLVNNRDAFAQKVQENVTDDMAKIGLKIVNFNVQNFTDENNAITDLGIDNLAKIQKEAKIAKANAEKEVSIQIAVAAQESNKAKVESEKKIAEQNKELEIAQANAKATSDVEKAKAQSAFEIQKQIQQKTINEKAIEADTAKAEKMLALKEREIELKERELDATVRKAADAEKYSIEQKAEAEKIRRIKVAEAQKEEALREAEAISAKGKAEAESIRQKALAEAEGIEKKAEAQAKMKNASIIEMAFKALPEIAKEVSAPLNNIETITMYDPNGTTKLMESGTRNIGQVLEIAKNAGIDLPALINGFVGNLAAEKISKNTAKVKTLKER